MVAEGDLPFPLCLYGIEPVADDPCRSCLISVIAALIFDSEVAHGSDDLTTSVRGVCGV